MKWPVKKLGEICIIKRGTTITKKDTVDGDIPVVAGGIRPTYYHNESNRDGHVITVSGSGANAGFINFYKEPIFASDCSTVESLNNNIDIQYIYFAIKNLQEWIYLKLRSGAAQPHVYAKDLRELKISLPPLLEQQRITSILNLANSILYKRKEAINKLDMLTTSTFADMFGDPYVNNKKLARIKLEKILKFKSGKFLPANKMKKGGQFAVYGGNGINGRHNEFMFAEPKIVIGRVGAYCGSIHITEAKSWVTDNALYVDLIADDIDFEYLAFALQNAKLNQYSTQFGQPLISSSRIYPTKILMPNLQEQKKFANNKKKINENKKLLINSKLFIINFIRSLQHQSFGMNQYE